MKKFKGLDYKGEKVTQNVFLKRAEIDKQEKRNFKDKPTKANSLSH